MAVNGLHLDFSGRLHLTAGSGGERGSLLVLLNPGRVSRHCLLDMVSAGKTLGLEVHCLELGSVWELLKAGKTLDVASLSQWLRDRNVRAVLGYTYNGLCEFPSMQMGNGRLVSYFEQLGIPHLMWWTDHPQWAHERIVLSAELQPLLASENQFHFVKSNTAAEEIKGILHWKHCIGLPVAENPARYRIDDSPNPEYDIVCISGAPPSLHPDLASMLDGREPNLDEILDVVEKQVRPQLQALLTERGPVELLGELEEFGKQWTLAKRRDHLASAYQLFCALEHGFPSSAQWLRRHWRNYFDALEILWEFGRWQRTFYVQYLAKHFHVGIFGSDWTSVGLGPGGWVDYDDQARVYRKGRIALSVPQAGDEQGVAHKPFQMAAARVPMAHLFRRGLEECFVPASEVLALVSPTDARQQLGSLLGDAGRRQSMADAANERLIRDHTWEVRLPQMLSVLGERSPLPSDKMAGGPTLGTVTTASSQAAHAVTNKK